MALDGAAWLTFRTKAAHGCGYRSILITCENHALHIDGLCRCRTDIQGHKKVMTTELLGYVFQVYPRQVDVVPAKLLDQLQRPHRKLDSQRKQPRRDVRGSPGRNPTLLSPTSPSKEAEHAQQPAQDFLPPYSVILHNDNHNPMDFVVASLLKSVSSLTTEEAIAIMLDTHNEGEAVVITCPLEHAELYRDRIRTFGLAATTEKA